MQRNMLSASALAAGELRVAPSIENGREEIADILEQSPSLRRTLPGLMTKNYPRAVAQAARDTRLPLDSFPDQPPFTLEEVLGEQA